MLFEIFPFSFMKNWNLIFICWCGHVLALYMESEIYSVAGVLSGIHSLFACETINASVIKLLKLLKIIKHQSSQLLYRILLTFGHLWFFFNMINI